MTYDATIFFDSTKDRQFAKELLTSITIDQKPIFLIETEGHPEDRLFLRLIYFGAPKIDLKFSVNYSGLNPEINKKYLFQDYFSFLGFQTGRHIPIGNVFATDIKFEKSIPNHHLYNAILREIIPEK